VNLNDAGDVVETDVRVRKESRGLLYGFAEYHWSGGCARSPCSRGPRREQLPARHRSRQGPAHVAIVMDGNGRWATQRGLQRTDGHAAGEEALADTVEGGVEVGLKWLTVYAFSTENWRRPAGEVLYLMNFNRTLLRRRRDRFHELNVRIRFTGRRDWRVPRSVLREIVAAEEMTRDNTGMTLTIAFNYGGRVEIVDAVKQIVRDHDAGKLRPRRSRSIRSSSGSTTRTCPIRTS
jgi:undecaprenyl diphosphate synthase